MSKTLEFELGDLSYIEMLEDCLALLTSVETEEIVVMVTVNLAKHWLTIEVE